MTTARARWQLPAFVGWGCYGDSPRDSTPPPRRRSGTAAGASSSARPQSRRAAGGEELPPSPDSRGSEEGLSANELRNQATV
ncbi:hypothetical protein AOLI_G00278930 [Acnodon oligacanthus]